MEWISFFERQPEDGDKIWYYGPYIGVWRGEYHYVPNDPISHHNIHSTECAGFCDRMDAPWWMPDDGKMERPAKPKSDYPKDYPNYE